MPNQKGVFSLINSILRPPQKDTLALGQHTEGPLLVTDIIAPPAIEVDFDLLKVGDWYYRSL